MGGFETMQIVQDGEKQKPVNENARQFLASDVFDFRIRVAENSVAHKQENGPTDPHPKQPELRIDDEAECPYDEDRDREPFDDYEILRTHGTGRDRRIDQNKKREPENDAFAPGIEEFAIKQAGARGIHGSCSGRKLSRYSFHTLTKILARISDVT